MLPIIKHRELRTESEIYSKQFPEFGQPKIIGYIDLENIKFARQFSEKIVKYDLNLLYEETKHKQQDLDYRPTELIKFLFHHKSRLNFPSVYTLYTSKFFCNRGLMTLVACTPYETIEPWEIVAILYKGNIYLCARDTEYKRKYLQNLTERDKLCMSWGFKFEQYVLSDSPESEPNPNEPVDETAEFSLVFQTHLNRHKIVYRAEMDGIRSDKEPVSSPPTEEQGPDIVLEYLSTKEFIELKTHRHIELPKQETNFRRFKTKKWWCQSFLVGIDQILCGLRNDDGIVEELKIYQVKDLPKMSQRFWNPSVCLNFLDEFFTFVKTSFAREITRRHRPEALKNVQSLPLVSLLFEWRPGTPVQVSNNYVHEDDPILPSWFLDGYK